jgi:hypothetical protein
MGEALDAPEAGLVRVDPGLTERPIGSTLGLRVAGAKGVTGEEARLPGDREEPADAYIDSPSAHVPADEPLRHAVLR